MLFLLFADTYGDVVDEKGRPEAFEWAPETIKMQLEEDFHLKLPKISLDKLMAAITVATSNYFWKDVDKFIELCNIFGGDDFQPDEFDPADTGEILWGIVEASIIWPPDHEDPDDTEFSPEVRGYIEEVLKTDGIVDPPDVLRLGFNPDMSNRVRADYADDPEMFGAIWDVQRGRGDDLRQMVRGNLDELANQLAILPLQTGKADALIEQVREMATKLPAPEEESL